MTTLNKKTIPIPYDDNVANSWVSLNKTTGINNVQTYPQGNLPAFNFQKTQKSKNEFINLYFNVGALMRSDE